MPCAVICLPDTVLEKCKADIAALQKKVKDMKFAVVHKPLDAMEKANEMAESEPSKKCSLFIIHSKFFNITKDPFCATLFKTMQKRGSAGFGCGKHSACDKIGKKFHWYMGGDGEWDINTAAKNCEKLMDGEFTEAGFQGKPLRKASKSNSGALASSGSLAGSQRMMGGMGMGGMGMMGGMGGMGAMGGGMGGMGTMGGTMGSTMGSAVSGGMGTMGGGMGMGTMGGGMGAMGGGMGTMGGGMGGMGTLGGSMTDLNSLSGGMSGSLGASGPITSLSAPVGMTPPAPVPSPTTDILTETENMLSQGLPVAEVVKMLANEVQRLSNLVQPRA